MTDQEIIKGLRRIAAKEGRELQCMACGYEHNCSIHGCRIIKAAADRLEEIVSGLDTRSADQMFQELGYKKVIPAGFTLAIAEYENASIVPGKVASIRLYRGRDGLAVNAFCGDEKCGMIDEEVFAVAQLIREKGEPI